MVWNESPINRLQLYSLALHLWKSQGSAHPNCKWWVSAWESHLPDKGAFLGQERLGWGEGEEVWTQLQPMVRLQALVSVQVQHRAAQTQHVIAHTDPDLLSLAWPSWLFQLYSDVSARCLTYLPLWDKGKWPTQNTAQFSLPLYREDQFPPRSLWSFQLTATWWTNIPCQVIRA